MKLSGSPLYGTSTEAYGCLQPNRWQQYFNCFELKTCMRQKDDDEFAKILNTIRFINIDQNNTIENVSDVELEAINFLRSRDIQEDHPDYPHGCLHIFPVNSEVRLHNLKRMKNIPKTFEIKPNDSVMDVSGSFKVSDQKEAKEDNGLPDSLLVGIGARVMITRNQDVEDKIVNGSLGSIIGLDFFKSNNIVKTIWVQLDDSKAGIIKRLSLDAELKKKYPKAIPIKREEAYLNVARGNSSFKRSQFPLKLAYAATIHKYQGRSLDQIVIGGFKNSFWKGGMFYTALTRARTSKGVFLPGFDPKCIKCNIKGKLEIERIRLQSLVKYKHPRLTFFKKYPLSDWTYISLQNITSLNSHADDILSDPIMRMSDIICLTETSLTSLTRKCLQKFFEYSIFDKMRENVSQNEKGKSGGVAIFVRKSSGNINNILSIPMQDMDDMEIIKCTLEFNHKVFALSLLYKDHQMPISVFKEKLKTVFDDELGKVSMIMGDFNRDMLKFNDLQTISKSYNYVPLVSTPTTIHQSLLDQIFIRPKNGLEFKLEVLPSYFSIHHLVVLCIKKTK